MASFYSTDGDIESFTSGDTDFNFTPERGIKILVFDCGKTDFLVAGEIVKKIALTSTEKAQRDVILDYATRNPNCLTINKDQCVEIFGVNHARFLSDIHSILVLLPFDPKSHVVFFISKLFSNSPIHTSQNESLLESPVPFFCRSLRKPVTVESMAYIKYEMSSDLQLCHQKEEAEKQTKIVLFNSPIHHVHAFYLDVVKNKTNIVKFVHHKTYQSSHTLHIECQSTDTMEHILQKYIKRASKDLPEFCCKDIKDFSVTDEDGTRVDNQRHAIICLLCSENTLMKGKQLSHSYPSFLIHLTPQLHSYFPIKVRIHGEERGHMHPFTVFIHNNFSTAELQNEISKHCHWNPKSFEVCLPNSHKRIDDLDNIKNLNLQLCLSVHRIQKLKFTVECNLQDIKSMSFEEFPLCSVENLKNKISKRCNLLPKQFDLIYKKRMLEENTLLESILEKNSNLELKVNHNRIIFRLYLQKRLPNREAMDIYDNFVHVKVDDPGSEIGEITSSFAKKLSIEEEDLHVSHKGFYLEKKQTYKDCDVEDGSILCLCHSTRGDNSSSVDTVFQYHPSGSFDKVSENSVTAMAIKLRKLQLKEKKKEPNVHIISRRPSNQKIFNRMISVPSKSTRNSPTVDSLSGGYKSDTDLLYYSKGDNPKPSPSDSQLSSYFTNTIPQKSGLHVETQLPKSNQVPSVMLTPPVTPGSKVMDQNRPSSLPGSSGFHITWWTTNDVGGNIPNIAGIIGPATQNIPTFPTDAGDPYSKLFLHISKEIAPDWKTVGIYLDLDAGNRNIIDQNYNRVEDKAYNMLWKWRELKGNKATKGVLIKALEDSELKRVAEIVERFPLAVQHTEDDDGERRGSDIFDLEMDGVDTSDEDSAKSKFY